MGRDICFGVKVKIKICENEDWKKCILLLLNYFSFDLNFIVFFGLNCD